MSEPRGTAALNERCRCSAAWAWAWVEDVVEEALKGDPDYTHILPRAIEHALGDRSECPVIPDEFVSAALAWTAHNKNHTPGSATWCSYCHEDALR